MSDNDQDNHRKIIVIPPVDAISSVPVEKISSSAGIIFKPQADDLSPLGLDARTITLGSGAVIGDVVDFSASVGQAPSRSNALLAEFMAAGFGMTFDSTIRSTLPEEIKLEKEEKLRQISAKLSDIEQKTGLGAAVRIFDEISFQQHGQKDDFDWEQKPAPIMSLKPPSLQIDKP